MNESRESPLAMAAAGACALALAMGIGRFAYTPMLPLMLATGELGLSGAGIVASANFLGYLAGALLATHGGFAKRPAHWLRAGIALSIFTTAAMALQAGAAGWAALRFAAGVSSAFVLVYASGMIFEIAARTARPMLGALLYSGVGLGIVLSALVAHLGQRAGFGAGGLWIAMGLIAALLAIAPWSRMRPSGPAPEPAASRPERMSRAAGRLPSGAAQALSRLTLAYGLLGFGYVITATFIVVMVRRLPDAPTWEFWTWMTVGLAGAPSNWFWGRIASRTGPYRAIVSAFLLEAIGVALVAIGSGPAAILAGAIFLGGTFMAITAIGLAAARTLSASQPEQTIARMTVAFSLGQIAGPAIGGWLAERSGSFVSASWLAVAALLAGAMLTRSAGRKLARQA